MCALIKILASDVLHFSKFAVFVFVPLGFSATPRELSVISLGFPANLQVVALSELFQLWLAFLHCGGYFGSRG